MASAANILNNTILVPYHDSLTNKSHDLEKTTIVSDVEAYYADANKTSRREIFQNEFEISIISSESKKSTPVGLCQRVEGLSVSRDVEKKRAGGESYYEIKLPGAISYGEVILSHLYTESTVFLDWLINGADKGGALMADIEIKVGYLDSNDKNLKQMVYTLRDAFPIRWRLGNIEVVSVDEVTNIKSMQAKDGKIPLEEITLVFGRMDLSKSS